MVSVNDSGIGIAADPLPRIFEMFTQTARALHRAQRGLGIGSTLVKRLVEMHGGSIEARSDGPDKRSEFEVRLPIVVEECPPEVVSRLAGGEEMRIPDRADPAVVLARAFSRQNTSPQALVLLDVG